TTRCRCTWRTTRPPTRSTRCGWTQTPSFAIAAYADAIWIGVTAIPCPIGTLPIVDPYQWSSGSTCPGLSPGKARPVVLPNPKRLIQSISPGAPSFSAIVTAPTLDECERIVATDIVSVGRGSASWTIRSATGIEYGSRNVVPGVTIPSERAPA